MVREKYNISSPVRRSWYRSDIGGNRVGDRGSNTVGTGIDVSRLYHSRPERDARAKAQTGSREYRAPTSETHIPIFARLRLRPSDKAAWIEPDQTAVALDDINMAEGDASFEVYTDAGEIRQVYAANVVAHDIPVHLEHSPSNP